MLSRITQKPPNENLCGLLKQDLYRPDTQQHCQSIEVILLDE